MSHDALQAEMNKVRQAAFNRALRIAQNYWDGNILYSEALSQLTIQEYFTEVEARDLLLKIGKFDTTGGQYAVRQDAGHKN